MQRHECYRITLLQLLDFFLNILLVVYIVLHLFYNKRTFRNIACFANILFHSLYFYFIHKDNVFLMLFTPVIMFLVDIFIFKNNQYIAYFSSSILFTYNLIFFIFHERKFNQIFLLIAFSSFIYTIFFSFLFFYQWKRNEIVFKKTFENSHQNDSNLQEVVKQENKYIEKNKIESTERFEDDQITFQ